MSYSLKAINWAAFFFGAFWMAYRKMYAVVIIYFIAQLLVSEVEAFFALPVSVKTATSIAFMFFCGFFGNPLYKRHIERKVAKIKTSFKAELWDAQLRKKGGVSYIAPVPVFVLVLVNWLGMLVGQLGLVK